MWQDFLRKQKLNKIQQLQSDLNTAQNKLPKCQQKILKLNQDISALSQEIDQIHQNIDSLKQGVQPVERLNLSADPDDELTIYNPYHIYLGADGSIELKSSKNKEKTQFTISHTLMLFTISHALQNDIIDDMEKNPDYTANDRESYTIKARDFKGKLTFHLYCDDNSKEFVFVSSEEAKKLDPSEKNIIIIENKVAVHKLDYVAVWKKETITNGKRDIYYDFYFEVTWDGTTFPSIKISQMIESEKVNKWKISDNEISLSEKQQLLTKSKEKLQKQINYQKELEDDITKLNNEIEQLQNSFS